MRYFVAHGETDRLDPAARAGRRGDFAVLSDGTTHYELAGPGDGPVFAFVPGLTIPLDFWDDVIAVLHGRGFRTLTYSAYGRGYSDRVRGRYGRSLFVRQLDDLIRHLRLSDVHLVGSSMGALIALAHAANARVASLTMSGPAGLSAERNPIALLPGPLLPLAGKHLLRRNLLAHLDRNVQSTVDAERLRTLVLDGFRFEGSMYALTSTLKHFPFTNQDALFDAAGLPPTQLVWGANDRVTPATAFDRAVELLKPVRAEHIPDCGHMASFERPRQFADLLTTFVTERQP
ncbi:alpha/beta fold hydrolase [Saccharothrix variisporea]|uniref:Pimeloyl-ACP methyl ester carboxylesterase n=1 Tax=Saccharothrix variisporea TaxID=543527 RepID=A0A495XJR0_9PSEU|nr:alpha/beta hydrolase [Saccharothrix variisporea]RKT74761.1 pimeloyl-ACP methyl ester carboxylesterase [Saccharothrix variisporea]